MENRADEQSTLIKWYGEIKKAKNYSRMFFTLIISSFFLSILSYMFPLYFSLIIDNLILRNDFIVYFIIVLSLITSLFMIILSFLRAYMQGWLHNRLVLNFRKEYYEHLLKLPIKFFTDFPTGKITQRLFDDVEAVSGTIVGASVGICVEMTKIVMIFVILSFVGWKFLLIFILMAFFYVINILFFKKPIENLSRAVGVKIGELYSNIYDVIPGIKEVKNYTAEKYESKVFVGNNCGLFRAKMKSFVISNTMAMIADFIPAVGICFAFFFAVFEYKDGNLSLGFFVMVLSYLQMLKAPIEALVSVVTTLKQGRPAIERIEEITGQKTEDASMQKGFYYESGESFIPRIEFKNVFFSYPGTNINVLEDINMTIEEGKTVAIVGHTGAGKSTITSLILKYYLPISGNVFVSDRDTSNFKARDLRSHVAVVPQYPHIFYSTIEKNLTYGKKISAEKLTEVCKKIRLHDFIQTLPMGYQTILGENGVKLSGGQKQLVAIARAMIKNLPILILDEATSSLDSKSETVVKDALNQLIKNRTTIAIAHRLSTIINSDEIIAMEGGRIKEKGKHEDLLKIDGVYSKLYKEQFKKEYVKDIEYK